MNEPVPLEHDNQGAPIYGWQLGDRLDDETRRLLRERVDGNRA